LTPTIFASPDDGTVTIETFTEPRAVNVWLYTNGTSAVLRLWRHEESLEFPLRLYELQDHLDWASPQPDPPHNQRDDGEPRNERTE